MATAPHGPQAGELVGRIAGRRFERLGSRGGNAGDRSDPDGGIGRSERGAAERFRAAQARADSQCHPGVHKPGGMGLARIVEIDTTGGPGFDKQYDFLRDKEVVLTFDDGPWPGNTAAVLKALADECLKATFFEIGKHATWHPEITKQVIDAGMTVGTHTWSHKDLARNPYAKDLEQAQQEIEMGNSAVHMAAAGGKSRRSSGSRICSISRR